MVHDGVRHKFEVIPAAHDSQAKSSIFAARRGYSGVKASPPHKGVPPDSTIGRDEIGKATGILGVVRARLKDPMKIIVVADQVIADCSNSAPYATQALGTASQ